MSEIKSLASILLDPTQINQVAQACVSLIESEVSSKKGLKGMGIKAGFAAVKRWKPNVISQLVLTLLPEFVDAIEPFYQEFIKSGQADFKQYLMGQKDRVIMGLLSVTDLRASKSKHKILVSTYKKLRPLAEAQVAAAMPKLTSVLNSFGL